VYREELNTSRSQLLAKGHIPAKAIVIHRTADFMMVRLELRHHGAEKGSKRRGGIKGVYSPTPLRMITLCG
jgi:hypothetical protein